MKGNKEMTILKNSVGKYKSIFADNKDELKIEARNLRKKMAKYDKLIIRYSHEYKRSEEEYNLVIKELKKFNNDGVKNDK